MSTGKCRTHTHTYTNRHLSVCLSVYLQHTHGDDEKAIKQNREEQKEPAQILHHACNHYETVLMLEV